MEQPRVESLIAEIEGLSEADRQALAQKVLPLLLTTRAGLEEIDEALRDLSDDELRALVERARRRASRLSEDEVAAIIAEGLRAARAQGRPGHANHPDGRGRSQSDGHREDRFILLLSTPILKRSRTSCPGPRCSDDFG